MTFLPDPDSALTPKQLHAVESLLNGRTKAQAATAAGVSYRTLLRWLKQPPFRAALSEATDAALSDAAHRLAGSLDQAVSLLATIMNDDTASHPDRLRAASLIIRRGLDLVQQKELLERLAAVEAQLDPPYPPPP